MKKIKINKIRCKFCNDIIESINVHNFKSCNCQRIGIDGGKYSLIRYFISPDDFEELSEYETDDGIS